MLLFAGTIRGRDRTFLAKHFPEKELSATGGGATEQHLRSQLEEYFEGKRKDFDLPLDLHGTPFQLRVWSALREIPYGKTVNYGEIARGLGSSARAVGNANGKNPVPIIIPCHRVIGADGSLTGFGGGLEKKRYLLQLEGVEWPDSSRKSHPKLFQDL